MLRLLAAMTIELNLIDSSGSQPVSFQIRDLILAGYSGRNQEDVRRHFDELEELGLKPPDETPILFRVSNYLASTEASISVQDEFTSGEAEYVLLFDEGVTYVTCGSDHTSRSFEKYSIPASKQMYPKVFAKEAWRYEDVADHWDSLRLRSWSHKNGERVAYQDSLLADLLEPQKLIAEVESRRSMSRKGTALMSGTVSTLTGQMIYADCFDFELEDPILNRKIEHSYKISIL